MKKEIAYSSFDSGFTLIELLLVMVLIGALVGAAAGMMSSGGNDTRQLYHDVTRFKAKLNYIAEESIIKGVEYGVVVDESGYQFFVFDHELLDWAAEEDLPFEVMDWEEKYNVLLEVDDEQIDLSFQEYLDAEKQFQASKQEVDASFDEASENEEKKDMIRPSLIFTSDGESTPFDMEFSLNGSEAESIFLVSDGYQLIKIGYSDDES